MDSDQKIQNVEQQIIAIERGKLDGILCPYCELYNERGCRLLCCMTLAAAVAAIEQRRDVHEHLEMAEAIADRASRN